MQYRRWLQALVTVGVASTPSTAAIRAERPAPLAALQFLVGDWEGIGDQGGATGGFTFSARVQDQVIVRTNYSDTPATADKSASRHDDLMVIHVDAGLVKADYFDSEGHVIRYVVEGRPGVVVFLSDIKPAEPRYRLTYRQAPATTLLGTFEIAPPGRPDAFAPYLSWSARRPSQAALSDSLQPLAFLIGRWEGTSEGQPGAARVQREYTAVLNSRFIRVQNQSVYQPQAKNPKGEVHEDLGMFSFDSGRKRLVFRQFHKEGFVNQYVHDPTETGKVVFTTEAIENIPAGWRARETVCRPWDGCSSRRSSSSPRPGSPSRCTGTPDSGALSSTREGEQRRSGRPTDSTGLTLP